MRELKVQCDCGQKYKFDVEPVDNQMPFAVNCPICGRDGTEKANLLLRAEVEGSAAPLTATIQAVHAADQPRLRINSIARAESAPAEPQAASPPRPARFTRPTAAVTGPEKSGKKPNFAMGLLGGLLGVLIGATIYFLIFKYPGLRIKLLALVVGGLAGWGAELLGKGEGSNELGLITAVLVLAGIVGTQYFVALGWWHEYTSPQTTKSAYATSVVEAKEVIKAVPTGSDEEIRAHLVKLAADDGEKVSPASISADQIKEFREQELPGFKDLASGKLTKEQFDQKNELKPPTQAEKDSEDSTFKGVFLILLLSKANLFSLCAAAALAYKLSTNA